MSRRHDVRALCLAALAAVACAGPTRSGDPAARSVRQGLAEQAAANGDWPTAYRTADGLVAEDRNDDLARQLRARSLRHMGMAGEAELDLRQILTREPSRADAHGELGVVLDLQGRFAEGFAEHQEAQRLAPWDPRWMNNLAFALVLRGRPKDAIPMLEEALRAEPTSARLRNNLGFALAASGDFSRAAQQFRLAGPEAQAANNLAFAYERGSNLPQAFDLYLHATKLDPAQPRARANLEHVASQLGRSPSGETLSRIPQPEPKGGP
jgi:Flp pilus assembly protein TadD